MRLAAHSEKWITAPDAYSEADHRDLEIRLVKRTVDDDNAAPAGRVCAAYIATEYRCRYRVSDSGAARFYAQLGAAPCEGCNLAAQGCDKTKLKKIGDVLVFEADAFHRAEVVEFHAPPVPVADSDKKHEKKRKNRKSRKSGKKRPARTA